MRLRQHTNPHEGSLQHKDKIGLVTIRGACYVARFIVTLSSLIVSGCEKRDIGPGGIALPASFSIPDPSLAKPIPQMQQNWCWAASAQMILAWRHHEISQCKQADLYGWYNGSCCPRTPACDRVAFPLKSFKSAKTDYRRADIPLPLSALETEIAHGNPVVISWKWFRNCPPKTECGHMVVAVGYYPDGKDVMLELLDPFPPDVGGGYPAISYRDYVRKAGYWEHWSDFYGFRDGRGDQY